MGKIRARTDEELAARKQEILAAAKEQFMTMSYGSITLATIAEKPPFHDHPYTTIMTKRRVFSQI